MRFYILLLSILSYSFGLFAHGGKAHIPTISSNYEFVENKGQWPSAVIYKSDLPSGAVYFEKHTLTYNFFDAKMWYDQHHGKYAKADTLPNIQLHAFKQHFIGASPLTTVVGIEKQPHYNNYFLGDNPAGWASEVGIYKQLNYTNLYSGIHLNYYPAEGSMKYDFVVDAGADAAQIELYYEGLSNISIRNGELVLKTVLGQIVEEKPFAYQIINGIKKEVECKFSLTNSTVTFEFPKGYDHSKTLIIDPVLVFSTYSGSAVGNFGYTATFDENGFLYGAGTVFGAGYPTTTGPYQGSHAGGTGTYLLGTDIGITKFNTTGTARVYSTYLGGSGDDIPHSLVVSPLHELYVYGTTGSSNFPTTTGSIDVTFNGGGSLILGGIGVAFPNGVDMFVTKFTPAGNALAGSTFLGGSGSDGINSPADLKYNYADEIRGEIILDRQGFVYVGSCTQSTNFPILGGFQSSIGGLQDGVIAKLTNDLDTIIWSSYYGGSNNDAIYSIELDGSNNVYIGGGTKSNNLNITPGALQPTFGGGRADGFVAKVAANGLSILNSTYYGSDQYDQVYFVKLNKLGQVHVLGQTEKTGMFFIQNALYFNSGGGQIVAKFNSNLTSVTWKTAFGTVPGSPNISPTAFLVDLCNAVYIAGWGGIVNSSTTNNAGSVLNMPTLGGPIQSSPGDASGSDFYLCVIKDDASQLLYGSFFGGTSDEHVDGGTSRFDRKGKIYHAVCAGCGAGTYPTTTGVVATSSGALSTGNTCNLGVFKIDFLLPAVVADFNTPQPICKGDTFCFNNTSLEQGNSFYNWNFGDGTTSTLKNPCKAWSAAGTYDIRLIISDTGSCNLLDTVIKQITVVADTIITTPTVNYCLGDTIPVTVTLPSNPLNPYTSYSWFPTTGVIGSPTSVFISIVPNGSPTYYLTMNGLCVDTTIISFAPVNSIEANFGVNFPIYCETDSIQFLDSSMIQNNTTYSWDFGDGFTSNLPAPKHKYSAPGTYMVTLQLNDPQSCNLQDTVQHPVTIYNDTTFSLPNLPLCLGDTYFIPFPLPAPGPLVHYSWHPIPNLINPSSSTPGISPNQNMTFYLTNDICDDTVSLSIDVIDLSNSYSTNDTILCSSTIQPFDVVVYTHGLANTFQWSSNFQFSDTLNTNLADSSYNFNAINASSTLYIKATSPQGCQYLDSVTITISDYAFTYDSLQTICPGNSVQLVITNTNPANPLTFSWTPNPSLSGNLSSNTVTASPTATDTFYFEVVSGLGCQNNKWIEVFVEEMVVIPPIDTGFCDDAGPHTLVASSLGSNHNASFVWSSNQFFSDTLNQYPDSSHTFTLTDYYTYFYIRAKGEGGCTVDTFIRIGLFNYFIDVSADLGVCKDSTATLEVLSSHPNDQLSFTWSPDTFITAIENNGKRLIVNPSQPTVYVVTSTNLVNGCSTTDSISVMVSPLTASSVQILATDTLLFEGDSTFIAISPDNGYLYSWSPQSGLQNSNSSSTVAYPRSTTNYTVEITDPAVAGCRVYKSVEIEVYEYNCSEPHIYIPTAFTPNGDGKNEVYRIEGASLRYIEFSIFNRWGELIYYSNDMKEGWDGYYNGKGVENDVYVYHFKGYCWGGEIYISTGNITVVR